MFDLTLKIDGLMVGIEVLNFTYGCWLSIYFGSLKVRGCNEPFILRFIRCLLDYLLSKAWAEQLDMFSITTVFYLCSPSIREEQLSLVLIARALASFLGTSSIATGDIEWFFFMPSFVYCPEVIELTVIDV